jgi:hypothetical protein
LDDIVEAGEAASGVWAAAGVDERVAAATSHTIVRIGCPHFLRVEKADRVCDEYAGLGTSLIGFGVRESRDAN